MDVSHDNFTAAELAVMALILNNKAMETLKNTDPAPVQIKGPVDDGVEGNIPKGGKDGS